MKLSGRSTSIPTNFREFSPSGYRNAHLHRNMQGCERLYGTEMMLDGWDADILLLAKDAGPANVLLDEIIQREGSAGWRHAQRRRGDRGGWRTNERLIDIASSIPGRKMYGSACANLLRDDGKWSGALPRFHSEEVQTHLVAVLSWVVGEMPNLKAIGCLGRDSWYLVASAMGETSERGSWSRYRDGELSLAGCISGRPLHVTAHYHPGARKSLDQLRKGWATLGRL